MVIVWENNAKKQLKNAYKYILQYSYQNAIKVREDIINAVLSLHKFPERHPLDKYKNDNDGTWRAFEMHHYRVAYKVMEKQIRIVRLRHTKMSPLNY